MSGVVRQLGEGRDPLAAAERSGMTISKAVIPAAGRGGLLHPITKVQPKEMLPLGRKPAVHLVVEELVAAGLTDLCIVTSRGRRAIEDHFSFASGAAAMGSDRDAFPAALVEKRARVSFVEQPEPKGTGEALLCAREFVGDEPFVVALGDAVITGTNSAGGLVQRMEHTAEATGCDAVVAVRRVARAHVSQYGVVTPIGDPVGKAHFMIEDIVEKPPIEEAPSTIAVAGRYILHPLIFDYLEETPPGLGGDLQLTDALRQMVHDRESVWAEFMKPGERRFELDNFLQYSRAFIHFSLNDPEVGLSVKEYLQQLIGG